MAGLAGVSPSYYRRLERNAAVDASDAVLRSIARALLLGEAEGEYLLRQVRSQRGVRGAPADWGTEEPAVQPGVARVLLAFSAQPALVVNSRLDILHHNVLADELYGGLSDLSAAERNFARLVFADPGAPERFPDWDVTAQQTAGSLRLSAARHPQDGRMLRLVRDLQLLSEEFSRLWSAQLVTDDVRGQKAHRHREAGDLVLSYETFDVPRGGGQRLCVHTAESGSRSAHRLAELAAHAHRSGAAEGSS